MVLSWGLHRGWVFLTESLCSPPPRKVSCGLHSLLQGRSGKPKLKDAIGPELLHALERSSDENSKSQLEMQVARGTGKGMKNTSLEPWLGNAVLNLCRTGLVIGHYLPCCPLAFSQVCARTLRTEPPTYLQILHLPQTPSVTSPPLLAPVHSTLLNLSYALRQDTAGCSVFTMTQ